MSFTSKLELLEQRGAYPDRGPVVRRWGQLLKERPEVGALFDEATRSATMVQLRTLGRIRSGLVTRANSYFLVRELPFDQIPKRFHVTRRDFERVAVVMDGLESPHKIERAYLRRVIKGPDDLLSPAEVQDTGLRAFVVDVDRETLRSQRHQGALDYLRRGETVAYNTSNDPLKGGIPARRSQVKNRRPFWYSMTLPTYAGPRIVLPEHIDHRYLTTLLPATDDRLVIDTLYTLEINRPQYADFILACLGALVSWYQIELRGRTQHGEGVLKVKIPDWGGLLVANPDHFTAAERRDLVRAYKVLRNERTSDSLASAGDSSRLGFDSRYIQLLGWPSPEEARLVVERETRSAVSERHERKASVADSKIERRRSVGLAATSDAYAAKLASITDPYPNPQTFLSEDVPSMTIPIIGPVQGRLSVGMELFNQGEVLSNGACIAKTPDILSSQYLRGCLLHDPAAGSVDVPLEPYLQPLMELWHAATRDWEAAFLIKSDQQLRAINDVRLRAVIVEHARQLLHAD